MATTTTTLSQQRWKMAAGKVLRMPREGKFRDMDEMARHLIQLKKERDELQKDVEALCMQQAGFSSGLDVAQKIQSRRAVGLEAELSDTKHDLEIIFTERDTLEEELEMAYRAKTRVQDELDKANERTSSLESEVKYFQQQVSSIYSQRDKALTELEVVKFEHKNVENTMRDLYSRQRKIEAQLIETEKESFGLKGRLEIANVAIHELQNVMDMLREAGLRTGKTEDNELQKQEPRELAEALLGERKALQNANEEGKKRSEQMEKTLVAVTTEVSRALDEDREERNYVKAGIEKVLSEEKERIGRMRLELLEAFCDMKRVHEEEKAGRIQMEEELQGKIKALEEDLEESTKKVEELEEELSKEKEERAKENEETTERLDIEQEVRQVLERKVQDAETEIERLTEVVEELESNCDKLESELKKEREMAERVISEMTEQFMNEKMDSENRVQEVEGRLRVVQTEAEKKAREAETMMSMKEHQAKRILQDSELRVKDLESRVKDMQIRAKEAKDEEKKLNEELKRLRERQKKGEESEARMREERKEMQTARENMDKQLHEVLKELDKERHERQKLKEQEKATDVSVVRILSKEQLDMIEEQGMALAQVLNEKAATLLILNKNEERQRMDSNTIIMLQEEVDDLKEKLGQVTVEKVDGLLEIAKLKQQREALEDKIKDHDSSLVHRPQIHSSGLSRSSSMVLGGMSQQQPASPKTPISAPRDISLSSGELPSGAGAQNMAAVGTIMGVIRRGGWFKSSTIKKGVDGPVSAVLSSSNSFRRSSSVVVTGDEAASIARLKES